MRPQDDIDYTTLAWVKGELDETLKQASQALEAYVEDPSDVSQMRFCATYLHQVQGTLRMVELYGAAMVTEEMEQLAGAILDDQVTDRDEAYAVLMRGIMQLPDYLERLQSGHKDIPVVLLPLLNDLRAARGEKGLSEIALFNPLLGQELPETARGPAEPLSDADLRARAEPLRSQFQVALLKWFRNEDVDGSLERLAGTLDRVVNLTSELEARRLFWVAAGVLEALRAKAFEPSLQLKQTIGKVEREIKRLADAGERSFRQEPPHELTRNLLYFVAHAPTDHGRIGEMREVFRLQSLLANEQEVEHARGSLSGHNRSLLETVAGAIKEDLLRVKDALDLHMRNPQAEAAELSNQIEVLERVSDTLGMLGLGMPRRVVQEQRDAVHAVINGSTSADESTLLDIAGALLYVEASLDDQVQHLGGAPMPGAEEGTTAPSIETRRVLQALVKEAQVNFTRAKQCFVGYIESSWNAEQLDEAPALLTQVAGVLRIVELTEPADYLDAVAAFTRRELSEKRLVPDVTQMETLADALASLEYFLEAEAEQRPGRERILATAHSSLEKLGYWPVPAVEVEVDSEVSSIAPELEEPEVQEPQAAEEVALPSVDEAQLPTLEAVDGFDVDESPVSATETVEAIAPIESSVLMPALDEPAPEIHEAPAPAEAQMQAGVETPEEGPITGGFELASEEIDEEIREVFVEEVEEEIANLGQMLPSWLASPGDMEQLKSIRRVFHTLKGSGRLVGALTLGEFAWKVENMLNRVLDRTISPSPAVAALLEVAHGVLPEIHLALRGERSVHSDIEGIKDVADRLAAGEEAWYVPVAAEAVVETPIEPATAPEDSELQPSEEVEPAQEPAAEEAAVDAAPAPVEVPADEMAPPEALPDHRVEVAAIDPVLFEILKPEVAGHLDTLESWLSTPSQLLTEEVVRAVHTMNGAFAMTELPVITELTSPMEHYLKRALAHAEVPSPTGHQALLDAAAALRHALLELEAQPPRLTPLGELAQRIGAERDTLPEILAPSVALAPYDDLVEVPELSTAVSMDPEFETDAPESSFADLDETRPADDAFTPVVEADDDQSFTDFPELTAAVSLPTAEFVAHESPFDHDAAAPVEADALPTQTPDVHELEVEGELIEWLVSPEEPSEAATSAMDDEEALEIVGRDEGEAVFDQFIVDEVTDLPTEEVPTTAADEHRAPETGHDVDGSTIDETVASGEMGEAMPEAEAADAEMDTLIRQWLAEQASTPATETDEAPGAQIPEATSGFEEAGQGVGTVSADAFFDSLSVESSSDPVWRDSAEAEAEIDELLVPGLESDDSDEAAFITELLVDEPQQEAEPEGEAWDTGELATEEHVASLDEVSADVDEELDEAPDEVLPVEELEPDSVTDEEPAEFDTPPDSTQEEEALVEALAGEAVEDDSDAQAVDVETPDVMAEPTFAAALPPSADARMAAWFLDGLTASDPDPEAPLRLPDMDEELLDIFGEEASDILDHSDGLMAQLREAPGDHEVVVALQRDLHTLKGGARMAGLYPIGDLGHVMESLLEIVAEGRRALPRYGLDVLDVAFDRLNRMTARVASRQSIAMPALLIQRVDMLARGEEPELLEPAELLEDVVQTGEVERVLPEAPVAITPIEEPAESVAEAIAAPLELAPTALDEEDVSVRAPQEQIRIRADLLDRLVNYAGEVAIYRARLEQQLGLFRTNLAEMEQTNERLRGQLRKLEIETEAQIVARYQREAEAGGNEAFDPLELDRFSTLQQLSRALSESAADLVSLQGTLEDHTRQYETLLLQQSRVSSDLQEGLMRTRMVPFDSLVPRMRRIVRQSAAELGKKAQLRVEGAQGEMDRSVLDRMTAPLEHMLRNGLAHGLETPEERVALGKPEEGTIRISVLREGSEVVIKVSDDGRGLDREAIRRKAVDRGLLARDAVISDQALYAFILESGFSTATSVSKIAGRGVGMDVVHSEIRQLGGTLVIESEHGQGSTFIVRLPFTLAVTQAVFVQQGDTSYAIPIASVQGVARIDRAELDAQLASGSPTFVYAGEDYAIHDLGRLLNQTPVRAEGSMQVPLLLARSGEQRAAICVDNVIGSREIVVKPVGAQVSSIPGIFGATIMGDGRVIVILDVAPLVRRYVAQHDVGETREVPEVVPVRRVPLVMVVDDSITMRKVTGRVLERHGYEVLTAKDGVDAVEKLTDRVPDVMLLDIEMPRMDGYELATHIRNDVRLRGIPIIMITSRTGDKHRQRAFEIGVDRYLGKPYQEADLMRNVDEILKVQRGDVG